MVELKQLLRGKLVLYGLAFLLLLLVYAVAQNPRPLVQSLAGELSDTYYNFNSRQPPLELVFLEIENDSVRQFGRWPWRRSVLAEGLQRLEQAEVIGLDMLFSEATRARHDLALIQTLAQLPVIGGLFLNGPMSSELDEAAWSALADSAILGVQHSGLIASQRIELPTPQIREALPLLAALNITADDDQLFRHYPVAFQVHDLVLPNLAVQMWRLAKQQNVQLSAEHATLGAQYLPVDAQARLRLNFYPTDSWQRITFAELMQDDWQPERVAGRIVLVGISEAGVTDIRATPLGQIPGPLIHLTMLGNLFDGSLLTPINGLQLFSLMCVSLLIGIWTWQLRLPVVRIAVWGLQAVTLCVLGLLAYKYFNLWLEVFYPIVLLFLWLVLGEAWLFRISTAETRYLRNAFSSYVAPTLVNKLVKQGEDLHLGGQRQQITALFTDLRDFTPTTEALDTEVLVQHLNAYFGLMINRLHRYQGTLDKLIGDAVMALFNAPLADEDHAYHACLAAAAMMQALEEFNHRWPDDPIRQLRMGVGINTGEAIVGNIGAAGRFNYTAIGDAVNIAARLESATKEVQQQWQQLPAAQRPCQRVDILIGEATYKAVKDRLPCYPVEELVLKGKSQPLPAWVLDWQKMVQDSVL